MKIKKIDKIRIFKLIIIFLMILNIITPIIFMWIVELTMIFNEDILLTNGFTNAEPIQIYHILAYLMILSSIFSSFFVFYKLDKIYNE